MGEELAGPRSLQYPLRQTRPVREDSTREPDKRAMNLVVELSGIELDFEIAVNDPRATVGDLLGRLMEHPPDSAEGLVIGGTFYPGSKRLHDVGLCSGAVLTVGGRRSWEREVVPVAELGVVGGLLAGTRVPLRSGTYVLGSDGTADVVLDVPGVAPHHAQLHVDELGSCIVADLDAPQGTWVEEDLVTDPQPLGEDQMVGIGPVQLRVRRSRPGDALGTGLEGRSGPVVFNRPPRATLPHADPTLKTPGKPNEPTQSPFGWSSMLASLGMGGAMAIVNPAFAVFGLASPAMQGFGWIEQRRQLKKLREANRIEFEQKMQEFRAAMQQMQLQELRRRRSLLPDPADAIGRVSGPSTRLWERRPGHADFMQLVVGYGTAPWELNLADAGGERPPEVEAVLQSFTRIERCPVPVDLRPGKVLGVVGGRALALSLIRSLLCQAASEHGPADLRIAILTEPDKASDWDWVKWLPHTMSAEEGRGRRLLASIEEEVTSVLSQLLQRQAARSHLLEPATGASARPDHPLTLLVVDSASLTAGRDSPARNVLAGAGRPVAGIVLASSLAHLPASCSSVVELEGRGGNARCTEPATALVVDDLVVAGVPEHVAVTCGRELAGEDPEVKEQTADIPETVSLFGLLGLTAPTPQEVLARWDSARRVPASAGAVGATERGALVINLVSDGPHGLIAGTTGSGKSELLRTLVASLAWELAPEHLNFVLIDYKGGSAFDACSRLPHTVGMVTDLDEHLAERALTCMEAELRHRERRLREAGARDLNDYLAQGFPEPLPRLLVVIDEFAALVGELPDFVDSLVDIAQRGRSLGVHLILATQRPAGAVNDRPYRWRSSGECFRAREVAIVPRAVLAPAPDTA